VCSLIDHTLPLPVEAEVGCRDDEERRRTLSTMKVVSKAQCIQSGCTKSLDVSGRFWMRVDERLSAMRADAELGIEVGRDASLT